MKVMMLLIVLIVLAPSALAQVAGMGGISIVNSPHNLSASGPGTVKQVLAATIVDCKRNAPATTAPWQGLKTSPGLGSLLRTMVLL